MAGELSLQPSQGSCWISGQSTPPRPPPDPATSQEAGLKVSLAETQTLMTCPSHTAASLHRGHWASGSWPPASHMARSLLPKDTRLRVSPGTPTDLRLAPKGSDSYLPSLLGQPGSPPAHTDGTLLHPLPRRVNPEPPPGSPSYSSTQDLISNRQSPSSCLASIPSIRVPIALVSSGLLENCKPVTLFTAITRD